MGTCEPPPTGTGQPRRWWRAVVTGGGGGRRRRRRRWWRDVRAPVRVSYRGRVVLKLREVPRQCKCSHRHRHRHWSLSSSQPAGAEEAPFPAVGRYGLVAPRDRIAALETAADLSRPDGGDSDTLQQPSEAQLSVTMTVARPLRHRMPASLKAA